MSVKLSTESCKNKNISFYEDNSIKIAQIICIITVLLVTYKVFVWYGNSSRYEALQRDIRTTEKIPYTHLPALQDTYILRGVGVHSYQSAHKLFELSSQRYRSSEIRTTRIVVSTYLKAITTLNSGLNSPTL